VSRKKEERKKDMSVYFSVLSKAVALNSSQRELCIASLLIFGPACPRAQARDRETPA